MSAVIVDLTLTPALAPAGTACFEGAERRQTVAHGVSRGYRRAKCPSPGGAAENFARFVGTSRSIAPDGARIFSARYPTAHTVSYDLTPLRS